MMTYVLPNGDRKRARVREHLRRVPSYEVNTDVVIWPAALAEMRRVTCTTRKPGLLGGERDIGEVNAFVTSQ